MEKVIFHQALMHPKKKFGKHYGMMHPIVNGQVFLVQLLMRIRIGRKEAKFFSWMARVQGW